MTAPSAWQIQQVMALAGGVLSRMEHDGTADTDEAALLATLRDGGADVEMLLVRLLRARDEAIGQRRLLEERALALQLRRDRFERQRDAYTQAVASIMDLLGLQRVKTAEFTASLGVGKPAVVITDAAALPDSLVRITRTPDKTAIAIAIQAGAEVPGATMANGTPTLTVRTE